MMLQKMRDQTQGLGFKIVAGALILVLAVFGFGGFNLFAGGDPAVASVNGVDISQSQLMAESQREQQRLAAQFGEDFDPSLIDPAALQGQVLNRLIGQELLAQAADDLGIRADDAQIDDTIRSNPNFQLDGRFDADSYRRVVRLSGFSPQTFRDQIERSLSLDQLSGGVTRSAMVSDWELRNAALFMNQTRDLAYLNFDRAQFAKDVNVSDEAVEDFYEANEGEFMTPLTVDAEAVKLSWRDLKNDPGIEIDEARVLEVYESDNALAADDQERRDSSHILLRITDERDEAATLDAIKALAAELDAGVDFGELAKSESEDPGSRIQGGSLGPVGKGVFDPAFEAALWALTEPGELSPPVKSAFGYHLIRLDGIEERDLPTLAERRPEIEAQLREEAARALFEERLRELDALAFEYPDSLESIAKDLSLTVQTASGVSLTTGEGVFEDPAARTALFEPKVLDSGENSAAITLGDDSAAVVRVTQRFDPERKALADVSIEIRERLIQEQADQALETAFTEAQRALEDPSTSVSVVADGINGRWLTHANVSRSGLPDIPGAVVSAAFALAAPAADDRSVGTADLAEGGRALVLVTAVRPGDWSALSELERSSLTRFMSDRAARLDFSALYLDLEKSADLTKPDGV